MPSAGRAGGSLYGQQLNILGSVLCKCVRELRCVEVDSSIDDEWIRKKEKAKPKGKKRLTNNRLGIIIHTVYSKKNLHYTD